MSAKLWEGRTDGVTSAAAEAFNSSIPFDSRMYREDIEGSMAHARMLARCGIISDVDCSAITAGLQGIHDDIESGKLEIDSKAEDIHSFVEQTLTGRIGEAGKKLHTARSRNDQVALDLRMYLRRRASGIRQRLLEVCGALAGKAEEYYDAVMPGYTHLQRAQPVTFGHCLLAYAPMFLRDVGRIDDCLRRMNISPIGSCALAGTTYPTDRLGESLELGFDGICENSIDGVSDRDFGIELLSALSLIMTHLSRFSEEIILWASWEYRFITLDDAYTTGSSIMPQKKNPDMAELVRGKTGRVYGDLITLLTVMKGLPLAYDKDMQEDKEALFDACDTVDACLEIYEGMIPGIRADRERMLEAAAGGYINATDLADHIVSLGVPFRTAYKMSGRLVEICVRLGVPLSELPLEEYRRVCPQSGPDVFPAIDLHACVERRKSAGGTAPLQVRGQIVRLREELARLAGEGKSE